MTSSKSSILLGAIFTKDWDLLQWLLLIEDKLTEVSSLLKKYSPSLVEDRECIW
jgi:hypothetical protein